jgi:hypothetical protein
MSLKHNQEDTSIVSPDGDWKQELVAKANEVARRKKVMMTYHSKPYSDLIPAATLGAGMRIGDK